ncbi:heteromeric transposase endonuclease subunit TnsA [Aliagarivorans taiwanensis]|nr:MULTISPECIES: heteromeric transposase endonuclease subunit TnsA [Aliagarivorans]
MAKGKYELTEAKIRRWIKQGRGQGRGADYKPWITVRDVPSDGRSHRTFGHKTQRTHHLLSDLELAVFLMLEWHRDTQDIREQFPLDREVTRVLAADAGIRHPKSGQILNVMSSDFLVNTRDAQQPKFALQAKYSKFLADAATVEKLELERRYWEEKSIPWMIVTEKEIPKVVFSNILWLYPEQSNSQPQQSLLNKLSFYAHQMNENPDLRVVDIAKKLDVAYSLEPGESLFEMRQLLALRCFQFDVFTPYLQLKGRDLSVGNVAKMLEELNVSNQ